MYEKGLGLLLAGVLLLSMSACRQDPAPSIQNPTIGESTSSTQESTNNETTPENESTSHDSSSADENISHTSNTNTYLETDPEQSPAYNRAITAYNAFLNGQIAAKAKDDSERLISGYGRISDGQSGIDRYALFDVNNDGIPELFIDAAIDHILAFDGVNLAEWYSSMSWMGIQLLKNGAVLDIHSSTGVFYNYLTFGPGGIEKFIHFSSPPKGESGQFYYYGEGESEPSQKVSKDEWETLTKPYLEQAEKTVTLNWTEWR